MIWTCIPLSPNLNLHVFMKDREISCYSNLDELARVDVEHWTCRCFLKVINCIVIPINWTSITLSCNMNLHIIIKDREISHCPIQNELALVQVSQWICTYLSKVMIYVVIPMKETCIILSPNLNLHVFIKDRAIACSSNPNELALGDV
jgi:hypothetical protein